MTGQMPDTVVYQGAEYALIGLRGDPLPMPQDFGIEPASPHTGCYRGFVAGWLLEDNRFFLDNLTVWVESPAKLKDLPPINGIRPTKHGKYNQLRLPVPFTGTLRLATGFIDDFYVHQGFQKPSAFKTVLDVKLVDGRVVEVKDLSEEAARRRGEFKRRYMKDGDVVKSIDEAFDLDLDIW
jgi:hypothetical protein